MKTLQVVLATLLLTCWTPLAQATPRQAASGPALSAQQRQVVDDLLATRHPYECCRDTIAACLEQSPPCPLALRLERAIRRMAADGMSRGEIEAALVSREDIMARSTVVARIPSDRRFEAGSPEAPVVLSIYASGKSTRCAQLIPALYVEVSAGRLKGKVRLNYRPYFTGTDPTNEDCGRAMIAAADEGLFWPYLLHLYTEQDKLQPSLIRKWAYAAGVDICAFDVAYESPETASRLAAIQREGLENGVGPVPTAFIDGRRVRCGLTVETLVDLLDEQYERVTSQGARGASPRRAQN